MDVKQKKLTNKKQYECLVEEMKKSPDIAKGFTSNLSPQLLDSFWESCSQKLNSLGPPVKDSGRWKRVWCDYKSHIKKKLAINKQERNRTGGGPNKELKFSYLEEEVISLIGLRNTIEGIQKVKAFGAGTSKSQTDNSLHQQLEVEVNDPRENLQTAMSQQNVVTENSDNSDKENIDDGNVRDKEIPRKRQRKLTTFDLLQKQVRMQENFYKNLTEKISSCEKVFTDIQANTKRIYRALDKMNELKAKELEESARHKSEIEDLLRKKIQLKTELVDIELMKAKLNSNVADSSE